LRLAVEEHHQRRPRIRLNLEVLRLAGLEPNHAKHRGIICGFVDHAALDPMLSGVFQFFALLPVTLSK
jgi:hypothetical protein